MFSIESLSIRFNIPKHHKNSRSKSKFAFIQEANIFHLLAIEAKTKPKLVRVLKKNRLTFSEVAENVRAHSHHVGDVLPSHHPLLLLLMLFSEFSAFAQALFSLGCRLAVLSRHLLWC